ncbi:MAG TPA: hypothetical protein VGM97_11710 [Steroidobacteraceae bacterium]
MRPEVVYQVFFIKDGAALATPTVISEFGRELCVEVADTMRVLVSAQAPEPDGRSLTYAKMSLYRDGKWQLEQEMSMRAYLAMSPSFEHSIESTPYRFVVKQRSVVHSVEGEPDHFIVQPHRFTPEANKGAQ